MAKLQKMVDKMAENPSFFRKDAIFWLASLAEGVYL